MRILAALLISALVLMWAPQMSLAQEAPATHEHAMGPAADDTSYMTLQQVAIGAAVLSGAFAVGLLAGGSLSTGLAATSAVVIVYSLLP